MHRDPDIDTWLVQEDRLRSASAGVTASVFALSNGHVGVRGTVEEAGESDARGTFLAGVFEHHPLSYPEGGYGYPERGQAIVRVADGSGIHLQVDGVPLDLESIRPDDHRRTLDLRSGTLQRTTQWTTPRGHRMRLRSTRLVSLAHRSLSAVRWELESLDATVSVAVRSDLTVLGSSSVVDIPDPRVDEALAQPFSPCLHGAGQTGGHLVHRTRSSGIGVAAAVEHRLDLPPGASVSTRSSPDDLVTTVLAEVSPHAPLAVVKCVCHAWSRDGTDEETLQEAQEGLAVALRQGWDGVLSEQRAVLDGFWEDAAVEVSGDPDLEQALRYGLFQVLQSTALAHDAPIGAKGLTGHGYSGHTFWDIDGFVQPVLALLRPDPAAPLLRWRASTLDQARERARVLDLPGAAFAWRTVDGAEASPYWPASTAALHLNAVVSRAMGFWSDCTGRPLTELDGVEVLVETARLWAGAAHADHQGRMHLRGVTGPDEYSGVVDDNVFTTLMARWNLTAAAEACAGHPDEADRLDVGEDEQRRWRETAERLHVPYDPVLGVHPAHEGFTESPEWEFSSDPDRYPVHSHAHYATIYRRQVVKQADLVQALWWFPEEFTAEQAARDFDYYERRTVRDSSLSAAVQSVVAARVGHLDLAVDYLRESAFTDLRDLQGDAEEGLHLASLAGSWLALVCGVGGLRVDGDRLELAPRLPARLGTVAVRFRWRGRRLHLSIGPEGTELRLLDAGADPLDLVVDGTDVRLEAGAPVRVPLRREAPLLPTPRQPPTREPKS